MELVFGKVLAGETPALLPGAWNPPTRAHVAMAESALAWAGLVVLVLPRRFPHKPPQGAALERRLQWLVDIAQRRQRWAVAWSQGGLFVEMAREARTLLGAGRVLLVCGRDAAERIVSWDYGQGDSIDRQLEEYELLVAPRDGPYVAPARLEGRIHALNMGADWTEASSSEVRARMKSGGAWEPLVPEEIVESVRTAYS